MTASETPAPHPRKRRLGLWIALGVGALALIVAAGIVLAVATTAVGFVSDHKSYQITSTNMSPTLKPGDRVLTTKVNGRYSPRRGDIVVFTPPSSWGRENGKFVSRVIGIPNDTISCAGPDHPPVINGRTVTESYAHGGCGAAAYQVKVPANRLWIMGDNRTNSYDSEILYLRTNDVGQAAVPVTAVFSVAAK